MSVYKTIINLKNDVPIDVLSKIHDICSSAFDNRAGIIINKSDNPYCLVFEGEEKDYGCLHLGILALDKVENFKSFIASWDWIDEEEPRESGDVLKALSVQLNI